jgi:hypothetical protein
MPGPDGNFGRDLTDAEEETMKKVVPLAQSLTWEIGARTSIEISLRVAITKLVLISLACHLAPNEGIRFLRMPGPAGSAIR